jgi:hypothetical protein
MFLLKGIRCINHSLKLVFFHELHKADLSAVSAPSLRPLRLILKKEKVTQRYAENIRVSQRNNSVLLCGSQDFLCVTEKGFRSLYSLKKLRSRNVSKRHNFNKLFNNVSYYIILRD